MDKGYKRDLWAHIWSLHEADFEQALTDDDIDTADQLWSAAAVRFLAEATGNPRYWDGGVRRGGMPTFVAESDSDEFIGGGPYVPGVAAAGFRHHGH